MATITRRRKPAEVVTPKPKLPAPQPKPPKPELILGSWGDATIDQHDALFLAGAAAVKRKKSVRVNPRIMKAMMDVETDERKGNYPPTACRGCDGTDCVPACGPMQIKWPYHTQRAPELNRNKLADQIEMAFHIIGDTMLESGGDEYHALVTTYFPGDDVNGTTQGSYVARVRSLVAIMERDAADSGTTPAPKPKPKPTPVTEASILQLIASGRTDVYISFGFNEYNSLASGPIYRYGAGHGCDAGGRYHSGIDIWMPDNTPVTAIFGGEVLCVGGAGQNVWDEGCGYFTDDDGGIGRITLLCERSVTINGNAYRLSMTYGHMSSSLVRVGEHVADGQRIGYSGIGGDWPHVHLDCVIKAPELNNPAIQLDPGVYHLLDPIPAIINAAGGAALPVPYAARVDVPQPTEWESGALVTVTRDGVPLLQRADKDAAEVDSPFAKGDTFEAVMLVWDEDDEVWYWVTRRKTRVPLAGTASLQAPIIPRS